jgi:hypothetical protein
MRDHYDIPLCKPENWKKEGWKQERKEKGNWLFAYMYVSSGEISLSMCILFSSTMGGSIFLSVKC